MEGSVTVVGVGPGDPTMVTQQVRDLVARAEVLAGFRTAVAVVEQWVTGKKVPLDYRNQEQGLDTVAQRARDGKRCVVCCYGDPTVSDREFLALVRHRWPTAAVVPGISSVQVACAQARITAEDSLFITLHRRYGVDGALQELVEAITARRRHVVLLPRPWDLMPAALATYLLERGADPAREVLVYQRLTLPGESCLHATLAELAASPKQFSDLTVMVLPKPGQ